MGCRVLVAYASRFGSTAGIAEEVARVLNAAGLAAEAHPVDEAPPVSGFDAVVVGSAIYNARWMPEGFAFVERNADALREMPNAFFQVCLSVLHASGSKQRIIDAWMEPENRLAPPLTAATFPGALDRANLNSGERLLVWMSRVEDGDYRDWPAVRQWAELLGSLLLEEPACAD